MKIGIFLEGSPKIGGGFFQSLKSSFLLLGIESFKSNFELIITDKETYSYLNKENFQNKLYKPNIFIKYFSELFEIDLVKDLFFKLKIMHPFTKFLKENSYDLIIFLGPSMMSKYCGEVGFVTNIWDLDHKNNSQFPEHNKNFIFEKREKLIKEIIYRAFRIIVAHDSNKNELINFYNVKNNNIVVQNFIPMLPSIYEKNIHNQNKYIELFKDLDIPENKKIIFYPAQFWAHKNHKYIIDALKILKENKDERFFFVFCGANKGNLKFIENLIKRNNLEKFIKIYNFLTDDQVISLYLNCNAIVMPTYCGPTNLPIYESFYFKKIIFYTKDLIPNDDINNRLIEIDISSPLDFCKKLEICFDENKIEEITKSNFEYYKLVCNDKDFRVNYEKIIKDFIYLKSRWKN